MAEGCAPPRARTVGRPGPWPDGPAIPRSTDEVLSPVWRLGLTPPPRAAGPTWGGRRHPAPPPDRPEPAPGHAPRNRPCRPPHQPPALPPIRPPPRTIGSPETPQLRVDDAVCDKK